MNIQAEDYDHVSVLSLIGELTADSVESLRKQIETRVESKVRFFVLDLERITFIDSKGLEMLLWAQDLCDERLGQIRLCNPDEHCRKILQLTRLEGRFDVYSDVTEAVKSMR